MSVRLTVPVPPPLALRALPSYLVVVWGQLAGGIGGGIGGGGGIGRLSSISLNMRGVISGMLMFFLFFPEYALLEK